MIGALTEALRTLVWGPGMLLLLLGTGFFLSIRCGFPQLTGLRPILRSTLGKLRGAKPRRPDALSPFQSMTTALAGTVGTGNIAGVTGAIFLGGPGAVFWMWTAALFGMCTKFVEIALAVRYRTVDEKGRPYGGPMLYIERGLGTKFRPLALCFALGGTLASFGIGNLAQSCEIASSAQALFGAPPTLTGCLLALLAALVLLGGAARVGRFTEVLVPLMAGIYLLAALPILLLHAGELPGLLRLIVRRAFGLDALGGGLFGCGMREALRQGFSRGVFSNEAGLGSAPMAHASSACREPCEQAGWGVIEVFVDTFVICTLTALVVLLSGVWNDPAGAAGFRSPGGAAAEAFRLLLPGGRGGQLVSFCLLFFALSSIIGWGYYGELCWRYLCGGRSSAVVFRLLFSLVCLLGTQGAGETLWAAADVCNALMALPNLAALLLLSGKAAAMSRAWLGNGTKA